MSAVADPKKNPNSQIARQNNSNYSWDKLHARYSNKLNRSEFDSNI